MRKPPQFTGKNEQTMADYVQYLKLKGMKDSTTLTKQWIMQALVIYTDNKDIVEIDKVDVNAYILHRRETRKPKTVHNDIVDLRLFFKWLKPDNDFFEGIESKQPKNRLPTTELLKQEDVMQMLTACQSQRDRALIITLWDSGARIGEIMNLNIRDIQLDKYGAVVVVDGKTGMRRLRLIAAVPDIQLWLNQHPQKDNPDAPLFVTHRKYDGELRRLDIRTVENMVKTIAEHASISKNVHPHAFRHGRLTDLVKMGFRESELRIIAGWEDDSAMPAVYIHMSGDDVESKMLKLHGVHTDEEDKEEAKDNLQPVVCPRCKTKNPYDAKYCSQCSMILDSKLAIEVEDKREEAQPDLSAILKDPEAMAQILMQLQNMVSEKKE